MAGIARRVAIALGSNLGDRRSHLDYAAGQLALLLDDSRLSPFVETEPLGVPGPQPPYLNAVIVGLSTLGARQLLDRCLEIEAARGRTRPSWLAPRTLDLDLVLAGDEVIDEPDLVVPHPRFRDRPFVLEPLAAVAPDLVDPVTGLAVERLWEICRMREVGRR